MNHLESVKKIVQLRRSDWAREVARLLESAPDYREIEKVECFPLNKTGHLWSIHINGVSVGSPIFSAAAAHQIANWLHDNRALFNLILPK